MALLFTVRVAADKRTPLMDTLSNHKALPCLGKWQLYRRNRGIGAAVARSLARLGALAVLCGRSTASLESVAKTIAEAGGRPK